MVDAPSLKGFKVRKDPGRVSVEVRRLGKLSVDRRPLVRHWETSGYLRLPASHTPGL